MSSPGRNSTSIGLSRPRRSGRLASRAALPLLLGGLVALLLLPPTALAAPNRTVVGEPSSEPRSATDASLPSLPGWTTFHGSENRSGFSSVAGPTTGGLLWQVAVSRFPVRAGPLATGTSVYVADELGEVTDLNETDNGTLLWNTTVGTGPTTPALSNGLLYVGDGQGNVTALSASNGSHRWVSSVGAPVVQGISVVAGSVVVGTSAGRIVALDPATGAVRWSSSLPGSIAGALAWDNGSFFVANTSGGVFRLGGTGAILWATSVGAPVDTAVAATLGHVFVADESGNVSALDESNGSIAWRYQDPDGGDKFETTPAVTPDVLIAMSDYGHDFALNPENGTLLWSRATTFSGEPLLAGAVIASNGAYLIDADYQIAHVNATTGATIWVVNTAYLFVLELAPPALVEGQLIVANLAGVVFDFGALSSAFRFPVPGTVEQSNGSAIPGATIAAAGAAALSSENGSFTLLLPNGSYVLNASAPGFIPVLLAVTVQGPHAPVLFVLAPIPVFPVTGRVVDRYSGRPLANASVTVIGGNGYIDTNETDAAGVFVVLAPNGSDYFSVGPPGGYSGVEGHYLVLGGVVVGGPLVLGLAPTSIQPPSADPFDWAVFAGLIGVAAAVVVAGLGWRARRKSEAGLSPSLLTPFERFLAMRFLLVVPQIFAVITLLYIFGTFLPAAALHDPPFLPAGTTCTGACSWTYFQNLVTAFCTGLGLFIVGLFTGNWGYATFGALYEPVVQYFVWWAPYTLELAIAAFALILAIAYPLGLYAGWRPDRPVDAGTRLLSIGALLVPTFLVVLLIVGGIYLPFVRTVGDTPYGIIPSQAWFDANGGIPSWIGAGQSTAPTGFPLVDGLVHQDWSFETITLAKTLLQASLIALVFIAIFLRFARHTVAQAVAEPYVTAARARGVPETRVLWRHTGRRVLPLFVLILGLTIPIYIGTQAIVEAMFGDPGLGTLLISEMTAVSEQGSVGYASLSNTHSGNIYEVAIFFTALVVLLASLCADVIARVLDPRLAAGEAA